MAAGSSLLLARQLQRNKSFTFRRIGAKCNREREEHFGLRTEEYEAELIKLTDAAVRLTRSLHALGNVW